MKRVGLMLMVVIASAMIPLIAAAQRSLDDDLHVVLPRDAIPAINKPEFEPVARAERYMNDRELLIGLVSEGEQRAYSTWQLDRHEIVNDTYSNDEWRGARSRFCVAEDDLTMLVDAETQSRWSIAHDEAATGPLKGSKLMRAPACPAYWFGWQGYFPNMDIWKLPR